MISATHGWFGPNDRSRIKACWRVAQFLGSIGREALKALSLSLNQALASRTRLPGQIPSETQTCSLYLTTNDYIIFVTNSSRPFHDTSLRFVCMSPTNSSGAQDDAFTDRTPLLSSRNFTAASDNLNAIENAHKAMEHQAAYDRFSAKEKRVIVTLVSFTGLIPRTCLIHAPIMEKTALISKLA